MPYVIVSPQTSTPGAPVIIIILFLNCQTPLQRLSPGGNFPAIARLAVGGILRRHDVTWSCAVAGTEERCENIRSTFQAANCSFNGDAHVQALLKLIIIPAWLIRFSSCLDASLTEAVTHNRRVLSPSISDGVVCV